MVAWYRSEGRSGAIEASVRPPGGVFGAPSGLGVGQASVPPVALAGDARGNAVLAWIRGPDNALMINVRAAGGVFGAAHLLDRDTADTERSPLTPTAPRRSCGDPATDASDCTGETGPRA